MLCLELRRKEFFIMSRNHIVESTATEKQIPHLEVIIPSTPIKPVYTKDRVDLFFENLNKKTDKFFEKADVYAYRIGRELGRLIVSLVIWYALGECIPGVREKIPSLYKFIDAGMDGIEWVYRWCWEIVSTVCQWLFR